MPGASLFHEVARRYDLEVAVGEPLAGGSESRITRITAGGRAFVVRVSPSWRTLQELTWAYELASYAAECFPEALPPLRTVDGAVAFEHDGHVVSLFPFVGGTMLDRESEIERDAAATLLAGLHTALPHWPGARPRPARGANAPPRIPLTDPVGFTDRVLDARIAEYSATVRPALSHADFYRGNLRCRDGRIVALFDWDDARYWPLATELAWSVWEFTQAGSAAVLDIDRASRFLDVYARSGGPVTLDDRSFVVPVIRDLLRAEVRIAAAHAEAGLSQDAGYIARSRAAFHALRAVVLPV